MNRLQEKNIGCPYCGEQIHVLLDLSVSHQNYIEDCQVCCRPIVFDVTASDDGQCIVNVFNEEE